MTGTPAPELDGPLQLSRARDEFGSSLRRLVDAATRRTATIEQLSALTGDLDRLVDQLEAAPLREGMHDSPFHPYSLVGGTSHPVAPQLMVTPSGNGVTGTVTLGKVFEGGPALAHGGALALLFDHAIGTAVFVAGHAAMTRTLDVHYRAPTPLDAELRVTAHIERVEGRKVYAAGEITVGSTVTATAEAVFIQLTEDNVAQIFAPRFSATDD